MIFRFIDDGFYGSSYIIFRCFENWIGLDRSIRPIGDDHGVFDFDITGSREINMMTFGAGRRICPGYGLAILHLEYVVANLVRVLNGRQWREMKLISKARVCNSNEE